MINALLVGGPAHGSTIKLERAQPEYLVAEQVDLAFVRAMVDPCEQVASLGSAPIHRYSRIHECVTPRLAGTWYYEWQGVGR